MKIAIISAAYSRHVITRLAWDRLQMTMDAVDHQFQVWVSGDQDVHRTMVLDRGWNWVEHHNKYTGQKFNASMAAAGTWDPDFVMTIGSDDLILPELFDRYRPMMESGCDFFGVNQIHFYQVEKRRMKLFTGYPTPTTIGAGRMYSRRLCRSMEWKIWPNKVKRGLDSKASRKCSDKGFDERLVAVGPLICDLKSSVNLNHYDLIPGTDICPSNLFPYIEGISWPFPIPEVIHITPITV